ncbi:MAG: phosphomannomutase/phosphoglucomutase, partial [Luteimonas sp.]
MSEKEPRQAGALLAQARPVAPLLAVVLVLGALWFAWSGWQQLRGGQRVTAVEQGRDAAVAATGQALGVELKRIDTRLADPAVQRALDAGDLDAAGKALAGEWPGLEAAEVVPADLHAAYAGLESGGFGRLAALEEALVEDRAVLVIAQVDGAPRLLVAAPARVGERLAGIALVRLPLSLATAGLESASMDAATYLALRQGSHTVLARGDTGLANVAARLSQPVPGTPLRVAAAVPHLGQAPLGLGAMPLLAGAGLLLLLAVAAWRLPRTASPGTKAEDTTPTFAEALRTPVAADAVEGEDGAPVPVPARSETPKKKAAPASVVLDPSIFRAYDIRGVVGQTLDAGVAE